VTELGELRKHYREILDRGVAVAAVSVDPPDVSELLRRRLDLDIRFLSDREGVLLDALGIRHTDGRPPAALMPPGHREKVPDRDIFLPATFLVEVPDAPGAAPVIRWVYRPDTYRVRATPEEILAAIDANDGVGNQAASNPTR
jgi:peroxiredoxin